MSKKPSYLYRAFTEEQFAKQFVESGLIRLGLMTSYTEIEDQCRQDHGEGESSWYVSNGHVTGDQINQMYLLCTASPDVDLKHLRKYGDWVVRINDPICLMNDLCVAAPVNTNMKLLGQCKLEQVKYNKGEVLNLDPDSGEAYKLPYTQKPSSYQGDHEYRYVITADMLGGSYPVDLFLHYDLNKPISYAELL